VPAETRDAAPAATSAAALLQRADAALDDQRYDAAIELYDQVLGLEPANQRAGIGRSSALGAKAMARAGGTRGGLGRGFVSGETSARSPEQEEDGSAPEGFEATPGVAARAGDQLAALPAQIEFEMSPETPRPGEPYTVRVYLLNGGDAAIEVREVRTQTRIDGRTAAGTVPSLTRAAAPRQRAAVLTLSDYWRGGISSWSLEVTIRTGRGDTYRNQLAWR
jgi:hypothetical protein